MSDDIQEAITILHTAADAVERVATHPAGIHDDDAALVISLRGAACDLEAGRPVPNLNNAVTAARRFIEFLERKP